jgi:hypothetical protein
MAVVAGREPFFGDPGMRPGLPPSSSSLDPDIPGAVLVAPSWWRRPGGAVLVAQFVEEHALGMGLGNRAGGYVRRGRVVACAHSPAL